MDLSSGGEKYSACTLIVGEGCCSSECNMDCDAWIFLARQLLNE